MPTLDMKRLRQIADQPLGPQAAEDAVLALGGLASWWLSDETLAVARGLGDPELDKLLGDGLPTPASDIGSCWVVCAVTGDFPLLRPAVVLPLRWMKDKPHSENLPCELRKLSEQVQKAVIAEGLKAEGWGLQPMFATDYVLADNLFATLGSGWGAVVAGLIGAVLKLEPNPKTWASVAWNDSGHLEPVGLLAAKIATAAQFGATKFYVHPDQSGETVGRLITTAAGPKTARGVSESLREYLADITQEPAPPPADGSGDYGEPFETCRRHYKKLIAFSKRADVFYASRLLPAIVRRVQEKFVQQTGGVPIRRFVTVVSQSPELTELLVPALNPERVLLLHTRDQKPADRQEALAQTCKTRLEQQTSSDGGKVVCELAPFDEVTAHEEIPALIAAFTAGVAAEHVILDFKPGTKKMTYSVIAAAQPGQRLLNLRTEMLVDRRVDPGTEIPELLPAISSHRP